MRPRLRTILRVAAAAALLPLAPAIQAGAAPGPASMPVMTETAPAPPAEPASLGARFEFIPLRHVLFEHDEALLDERALRIIDDAILYLKYATGIDRVIINGHADYTAADAYNDQLSDQRTAVVHDYMVAKGVTAALLYTGGLGEHTPVDENWTRVGRTRNRRVEIYVIRHSDPP